MGQMIGMTARASDQAPSAFSDKGERPMGTPSPDTGKSDLRGGTMFRQGAITPGDEDQGEEGSATGAPSGHAPAKALEGRATRRLDAVLKLESVKVSGDQQNENTEQESAWFYSASQQEQSEAAYADVRGREDYAGADVMRPGRVPIQQRQAVRDYFINIHEGDNQ